MKIIWIFVIWCLFNCGNERNNVQTTRNICAVFADCAIAESTFSKWFARFRCRNFDSWKTEYAPGSLQPLMLITNSPGYTIRNITVIQHILLKGVVRPLETLGYLIHFDVYVPHDLTKKKQTLLARISTCDSMLKRNRNDTFFKRTAIDDEKWTIYKNVKRKESWEKWY